MHSLRPAKFSREKGAALVTGLIALLLLTVIGVAGMQASTMEERMAANARRRDIAFHAADSGLRAGESYLQGLASPLDQALFDPKCNSTGGRYLGKCSAKTPIWETLETANGWTDSTKAYQVSTWPTPNWESSNTAVAAPSYILEEVQRGGLLNDNLEVPRPNPDAVMYRITARGTGPGKTPDSFAIVQSTFKKAE